MKKSESTKIQINKIYPPIDYSFMEFSNLEDCLKEKPRIMANTPREHRLMPDKSNKSDSPQDEVKQAAEQSGKTTDVGQQQQDDEQHTKWKSASLKFNNNQLSSVANLLVVTQSLINEAAINVTWIDLSSNQLAEINPIFVSFENLKILLLHANKIDSIAEVKNLTACSNLRKLSLHENPMQTEKNFFFQVIANLPQLNNLNFTGITPGDRRTASSVRNSLEASKKKGNKDDYD